MTPRTPPRTTFLITASVVLTIALAALALQPSGPAPAEPTGPPTSLSTSTASIAAGQALARHFAEVFAGYLNGTRDPSDLTAAGASIELVEAITATPDRREPEDPPTHYAAEGILVRPVGRALQLTATFVDGDLRIPMLATLSRVGGRWRVTNLSASRD